MIIVIMISILALIIVTILRFTSERKKKTPEDIFTECIHNIDDIKFQYSFLGINYFLYKQYEIILWLPGYVSIIDHSSNKRTELHVDDEISYQLGKLLIQKIKQTNESTIT